MAKKSKITVAKAIGLFLIAFGIFVLSRLNLLGSAVCTSCPVCTPPPTCGASDVLCQIGTIPAGAGYTACLAGDTACMAANTPCYAQNIASALFNVFLFGLSLLVLLYAMLTAVRAVR